MIDLRKRLGIDEWLEIIKEDRVCNGAYISFAQYMYLLEKENQTYKEVINKAIKYIEENKHHEYRNGNLDEYYLELNEKEMTEFLDILKEVEHD